MLDRSECACVTAGALALGAIVYSNCRSSGLLGPNPTMCSARRAVAHADGVSARQGSTDAESDSNPMEDLFETPSADFEAHMQQRPTLPGGGDQAAQRNRANRDKEDMQKQNFTQPRNSKTLGAAVLVAGRCGKTVEVAKPKVSGGCMFFQSEAYSEQLMSQE